jgi:signal transduction histidine kinase
MEQAREWAQKWPPRWTEQRGTARVIRTGDPEFIPTISDDMLVEFAEDPEQLEIMRKLGMRSMITVPLTVRNHRFGALALLMSDSGRHYDETDFEVAIELGRRAGIAIENARLYRDAQHAVQLREKILAIVSHDLRSPLNVISLGSSALLQDDALTSDIRKRVEIIARSTSLMQRMIGDLLDLARVQSGTLAIEQTVQDAGELLRDSVALHEPIAASKGIKLVVASTLHHVALYCDRERIEQVFGNLLGNAIKFCRAGDTISVRATRVGNQVHYTFEDTGPGIPPEELPHVFELYWSGRKQPQTGLGLGLHISKGIVEAHGGDLSVVSTIGRGSTFTVRLPIERARADFARPSPPAPAPP